jgi:hypothetical protein
MSGITEDQGRTIIDLLKELLSELEHLRNESHDGAIIDELRELNSTVSGMSTAVGSIERDVSSIDGKD